MGEFWSAPCFCKTPLITLAFIHLPLIPPFSRRSKGKCPFWFSVTAKLPWTFGLSCTHAIPSKPKHSLVRITCPWPPPRWRGTSVPSYQKTHKCNQHLPISVTEWNTCPPPSSASPPTIITGFIRVYVLAMTSIDGWVRLKAKLTVKGAVWHSDKTGWWQMLSESATACVCPVFHWADPLSNVRAEGLAEAKPSVT